MSNIESEIDPIEPKAIIRYMLYTDVNRRRATQVGQDTWVDRATISFAALSKRSSKSKSPVDVLVIVMQPPRQMAKTVTAIPIENRD